MNCMIRNMIKSDIESLSHGFINQGWPGREEILARYFLEQESGEREVLVAEIDGAVAGYVTILPSAKHGPFAEVYPELSDFNVFEPFRNQPLEMNATSQNNDDLVLYLVKEFG